METEEIELIAAFRKGERLAFNRLYATYCRPVCYFSWQITGNMEQSEDIALETFSKLWLRRRDFDSLGAVKAFVYKAARNASLNYLRSLKVRSAVHENLLRSTDFQEDYVQAGIIRAQLLKYIHEEAERLPERLKIVFRMVYIEGLSSAEIAERLGMREQSVRNTKVRALAHLRKSLRKKGILSVFLIFVS